VSRAANGHPVTNVYLGLHIGDVFYGNIGSDERLDFTVVGPAVNEVSRIASMCRSVDRLIIVSAEFAAATPQPERGDLVSVGRYALRGVTRAQELFTLDPAIRPPPREFGLADAGMVRSPHRFIMPEPTRSADRG
jgi:adenylate cyclase